MQISKQQRLLDYSAYLRFDAIKQNETIERTSAHSCWVKSVWFWKRNRYILQFWFFPHQSQFRRKKVFMILVSSEHRGSIHWSTVFTEGVIVRRINGSKLNWEQICPQINVSQYFWRFLNFSSFSWVFAEICFTNWRLLINNLMEENNQVILAKRILRIAKCWCWLKILACSAYQKSTAVIKI